MNATSFTPGPWHVSNGKDVFAALGAPNADGVRTESNDAWQVADCEHFMSYVGGHEYELSSAEQRANANLIAAAPDLYQSLLEMVEDSDDVDDGKLPKISAATLTRARQALAKAVTP